MPTNLRFRAEHTACGSNQSGLVFKRSDQAGEWIALVANREWSVEAPASPRNQILADAFARPLLERRSRIHRRPQALGTLFLLSTCCPQGEGT
jgi:hypothetical protein